MDEAARARRRARRRDQLDDDGHARRHAGADEAPRRGGHPRDRRHGPGARGLQRRQAGLRRRSRQRAGYIERTRRRAEGRRATSSPARRSTTACSARRRTRSSSTRRSRKRSSAEFVAQGGYFLSTAEMDARRAACSSRRSGCRTRRSSASRRRSSPRSAASRCPPDTRVLHRAARRASAATIPLSIEKLCPVLSFYVVKDWREGCERCKQILRYGGMGHTMSIHSQNEQVILEFGLKKPAFRIVVNTPTTHGSIGLTTGLDPAMTLGCGGYGGNITSDNISPRHLLNIKRLAYEVTPAGRVPARPVDGRCRATGRHQRRSAGPECRRVPGAPRVRAGFRRSARRKPPAGGRGANQTPLEFVCEEDVRLRFRRAGNWWSPNAPSSLRRPGSSVRHIGCSPSRPGASDKTATDVPIRLIVDLPVRTDKLARP